MYTEKFKIITQKDFDKIKEKATEAMNCVPKSFNIKRFRSYNDYIIDNIRNANTRKAAKNYTHIITIEVENFGTSNYPKWERKIVITSLENRVENETNYFIFGKLKKNILAFVK